MNRLRAFIAIAFPLSLQHQIHIATSPLRKKIGSLVRWVPTDNLHLTLKFLGDISPANVEPLTRMLLAEAGRIDSFEIRVGKLGCFPNPRRPRVIFIGIQAPAGLEAIASGIESGCTALGYESESRGFHPHLTIGRVREGISTTDLQKIGRTLEAREIDSPGTARVDSVELYESELNRGGAVYTKLYSAPLHK